MLILSRKAGEKIIINGNIEITIAELRGSEVRIGISAPKNVSIYREEVYRKVQQENVKALVEKTPDLTKLELKGKKKK
jgi:carbon storage regulator